jgi:Holliday junction resolvase RusA-like endonuclease
MGGANWKRITFFIPGIPRGQSRPLSSVITRKDGNIVRSANGRAVIVHRKSAAQAIDEMRIMGVLTQHAPDRPIVGPVRLWVRAQVPVPTSKSQRWKKLALGGFLFPDNKKPDFDNVAKHLCDCFKGVIWGDDVQVIRGTVEKVYSEKPGYLVVLEYLADLQGSSE